MNCPKCKDVELTLSENNTPKSCPKCGGLWLESDSLNQLQELSNHTSGGHKNPDHDSKTGLCPQGHGILTRAKVDIEEPFYLEKCSKCYGIWFDKGEWQKVSEIQVEENLLNLWSFAWQKQQRLKKEEKALNSLNEQILGKELYQEIIGLARKLNQHPNRYQAVGLFNEELNKKSTIAKG